MTRLILLADEDCESDGLIFCFLQGFVIVFPRLKKEEMDFTVDCAIVGSGAIDLEAQTASVVDSVPGKAGPTPTFLIRRLVPSHQPPVTVAALTGFICAHACAGTHRTFGPVLRVRAPGNSPAAGHPGGVGNGTHDGSFDRAGVGPAASHAPGIRTVFLDTIVVYHS